MISTKKESLRPRSKKRAIQERAYKRIRDKFLEERPICEVDGCFYHSEDVHHKKGRLGVLLVDVKYFLAVCRVHHIVIENNPAWAKNNGYSLSRLGK